MRGKAVGYWNFRVGYWVFKTDRERQPMQQELN